MTADALDGGWFHTGDGGRMDEEGCLFSHPTVVEVAVVGVPSEKWGETIKALVVLATGSSVDEAELIAYCKLQLAGFKTPTSVEFRDAIPRTSTGKVQKFKLREEYWASQDLQVNRATH